MRRLLTASPLVVALALLGALGSITAAAFSQPLVRQSPGESFPPNLDAVIDRGLSFLQKQQRADGDQDGKATVRVGEGQPRLTTWAIGCARTAARGRASIPPAISGTPGRLRSRAAE